MSGKEERKSSSARSTRRSCASCRASCASCRNGSSTRASASSSSSRAATRPARAARSRRITERVSPRVFRVVALPAPSDREKSQMYMQRYMQHFPAAGEIVIFDRSWYNRAGVEHVMGFCTQGAARALPRAVPRGREVHRRRRHPAHQVSGWRSSDKEQKRRFEARIDDPLRQWKLSPMDLPSRSRWYEYSRARDAMLEATDTEHAPWYIVRSDDKKRARLNCIAHILSQIPYKKVDIPR